MHQSSMRRMAWFVSNYLESGGGGVASLSLMWGAAISMAHTGSCFRRNDLIMWALI